MPRLPVRQVRRRSGRNPRAGRKARIETGPQPTREQELAEQVAYLKAKVAYLEKLRALRASKSRGASEAPSSDCSQGGDTGSTTS